jgi:EGF-like domain
MMLSTVVSYTGKTILNLIYYDCISNFMLCLDCCSSTFQGWSVRRGIKLSSEFLEDEQPCLSQFRNGYCENGGRCYMRLTELYCACTPQWTGVRCMEKALEGSYIVKVPVTQPSVSKKIPTRTKRPPKNTEHITTNCTGKFAIDYCLHGGTCQKLKLNNAVEYMCLCSPPYFGERCQQKGLDGTYNTRIRRSVTNDSKKTNFLRKYR